MCVKDFSAITLRGASQWCLKKFSEGAPYYFDTSDFNACNFNACNFGTYTIGVESK